MPIIEDVMAPGLVVADRMMSVRQLRRLMRERGVHAVPVVDTFYNPLGIITSTDLLKAVEPKTRASKIMTKTLVTIRRQTGVATAARLMRKHRIHHIIVTQAGKVVGIVSSFDLLSLLERRRKPATGRRK